MKSIKDLKLGDDFTVVLNEDGKKYVLKGKIESITVDKEESYICNKCKNRDVPHYMDPCKACKHREKKEQTFLENYSKCFANDIWEHVFKFNAKGWE